MVKARKFSDGSKESVDSLLHRFKREVNNAGILAEVKKREYAMTKSQRRRVKRKEAEQKRRRYERMQSKFSYRPAYNDDFKGIRTPYLGQNIYDNSGEDAKEE